MGDNKKPVAETYSRRDALRRLGVTAASIVVAPAVLPDLLEPKASRSIDASQQRKVRVAPKKSAPPSQLRLPWNFLSKVSNDRTETVYVHAVKVTLNSNLGLDSGKNLTVYADIVRLTEMILLPGRDVYIFARRVIGGPVAGIDVSGAAVSQSPPSRVDGRDPGKAGDPGKEGAAGGKGGRITIYAQEIEGPLSLHANGGTGGKGQDGGYGHMGATGANGADADVNRHEVQEGGAGKPGGSGGDAGLGGNGGAGGDAGEISVNLLVMPTQAQQIAIQLTGGTGGDPGATGHAGDGGLGGFKGRGVSCHLTGGSHGGERTWVCEQEPIPNQRTGPQGPHGNVPSTEPHRGADGVTRGSAGCILLATTTELGDRASLTAILMRLHQSELNYLRGQLADAAAPLGWIIAITAGTPGTQTPQPGQYGSPTPSAATVQQTEWEGVRKSAQTLSTRLAVGLDYYGHPWDFTPLVDVEQYDAAADSFLNIAKDVEDAHAAYWSAEQGSQQRRDVLITMTDKTRTAIRAAQDEISKVDDETRKVLDNLTALDLSLAEQQQALFLTDLRFQEAVRQLNNPGCGFRQLVNLVGAVIAFTSAASPALAALPADLAAVNFGSGVADVVKQVKKVAGDIESLRGAYQGFQASIDAGARAQKILISLDDFERTLAPYMQLPEAHQYRDQMRTYVATSLTRNSQLLLYTSLVERRTQLDATVATQQGESDRIGALIAEGQDPALVEYDAYMGDLNVEAKRHAIDALYLLRRALEYRGVKRINDFDVNDQDVAALRALHGGLHQSRVNILQNQSGAKQQYSDVKVVFSATELGAAFRRFRPGTNGEHRIILAVPWDATEFQKIGGWGITASQVDVVIPRVRIRGRQLVASLTHRGMARVLDRDRIWQTFSHTPRGCRITRPLSGTGRRTVSLDNNLGGQQGFFAEVSPFASWELSISARDNPGLNLSGVRGIQLVFSGSFVPFT